MTSRERLIAALRRRPVDRLPVTLYEFHPFGGCWAADEPSYRPLMDAKGWNVPDIPMTSRSLEVPVR